jgi:hypothetical protein
MISALEQRHSAQNDRPEILPRKAVIKPPARASQAMIGTSRNAGEFFADAVGRDLRN